MKCGFTICTYSYSGLANVLKNSFIKYHEEYDFFVIFIDQKNNDLNSIFADDILMKYISEDVISDMHFQYDVTEYSTSVKPFVFKYLFEKGYEKVLYFDPDIKFYSKFSDVEDENYEAYVTPHKLDTTSIENVNGEVSMLKYGLFNCGFIGFNLSVKTSTFLDFWAQRLIDHSFNDPETGVYTDQKWVDFISIIMYEKVKIIKSLGCNYAPWNMDERKAIIKDDKYYITDSIVQDDMQELVFMHFSGFDYKALQSGHIRHGFRVFELYDALESVLCDYGKSLTEEKTNEYMNIPYTYNFYSNGEMISKINRRLYRKLKDEKEFRNPFDANEAFYKLMKHNKMIGKGKFDAKANNTKNVSGKKRAIYALLKIFKYILGVDRYTELLRALHKYSTYEMQTFLINER